MGPDADGMVAVSDGPASGPRGRSGIPRAVMIASTAIAASAFLAPAPGVLARPVRFAPAAAPRVFARAEVLAAALRAGRPLMTTAAMRGVPVMAAMAMLARRLAPMLPAAVMLGRGVPALAFAPPAPLASHLVAAPLPAPRSRVTPA